MVYVGEIMGLGTSSSTEKREPLIEQKMREKQNLFADIDFNSDYEQSENMPSTHKKIVFVHGDKNDGKTIAAYGFLEDDETALVLSFDNKSSRPLDVKEGLKFLRNAPITIHVINASKHYNMTDDATMLSTAELTYFYVVKILTDYMDPDNEKAMINGKAPDWIIIDGVDRMKSIFEMYMRKKNGLQPVAGVPIYMWQDRKNCLDNVYDKSLQGSTKGVIFISYSDVKELVDNCTVVKRKEVPKWFGKLKEETDIEIRAHAERDGKNSKYFAKICGSKFPNSYPDGDYEITGRRLCDVIHGD